MSAYVDAKRSFTEVVSTTVSFTTSGDNTVVAATTGRRIRVLALHMSVASAVNAKWTSGTTPDISNLIYFTAGELNVNLPYNPFGWFQTAAGALLGCNLSGTVVTNVQMTYVLI